MEFAYEAIEADGQVRVQSIEAASIPEAADMLRRQGLMVLKLRPQEGPAAPGVRRGFSLRRRSAGRGQALSLFAREMKMLLESGATLVSALNAAERQTSNDQFRRTLAKLRETVEKGASLTEAMEARSDVFNATVRSMITSGEATATLPQAFARLTELLEEQDRTRKVIVGALTYPALLTVMIFGALIVILTVVVPRFQVLFDTLKAPIPVSTQVMIGISAWLRANILMTLLGVGGAIAGLTMAARQPRLQARLRGALLRLPLVGPLISRLVLARVLRVWAATLSCHVPLLEAIQRAAETVRKTELEQLMKEIEDALTSGRRMGSVLTNSPLVPPVVASAISTAEENARLAEAVSFVSRWLDEDNARNVHAWAHMAEPVLLVVMGAIVGGIAMSLFIPLFDMATAAH